MLKREGVGGTGHTYWKLIVPDEVIAKGLEVGVIATEEGIEIGGEEITWDELDDAKKAAQAGE